MMEMSAIHRVSEEEEPPPPVAVMTRGGVAVGDGSWELRVHVTDLQVINV